MEKVYKSGLFKGIGVSNMSIKYLERISRECEVIPAVNQVRFPLALGFVRRDCVLWNSTYFICGSVLRSFDRSPDFKVTNILWCLRF